MGQGHATEVTHLRLNQQWRSVRFSSLEVKFLIDNSSCCNKKSYKHGSRPFVGQLFFLEIVLDALCCHKKKNWLRQLTDFILGISHNQFNCIFMAVCYLLVAPTSEGRTESHSGSQLKETLSESDKPEVSLGMGEVLELECYIYV